MYITFDKENKRVMYLGLKKPISYSDSLELAEVDKVPEKYDYLTVTNIQEKSRVVKEAYEEIVEYDENGELLQEPIYIQHEAETEIYYTCDLVPHFIVLTTEQVENKKQLKYETLVEKYIRERYSQGKMESIINNFLEYKETYSNENALLEYEKMQAYRKECKEKAHKEVYGL